MASIGSGGGVASFCHIVRVCCPWSTSPSLACVCPFYPAHCQLLAMGASHNTWLLIDPALVPAPCSIQPGSATLTTSIGAEQMWQLAHWAPQWEHVAPRHIDDAWILCWLTFYWWCPNVKMFSMVDGLCWGFYALCQHCWKGYCEGHTSVTGCVWLH